MYNAVKYLPALYDSLRAQSYERWEWVVVNDGSTDDSGKMLKEWAAKDSRIRYHESRNSGSAKQPRDMAVYLSRTRLIVCIDADDHVEADYLQKMYDRMRETGADIVYPVMRFFGADNETHKVLPANGFDRTKVYRGRDLIKETIPEWRIGCNGGLYDKAIWNNLSYPEKKSPVWMNSDETDERLYLARAGTVAFADTVYHYRNHTESITTNISPKLFHRLKTNRQLLDFITSEFGRDSREYKLMNRQLFYTWRGYLAIYVKNFTRFYADRDIIYNDLAENFGLTDKSALSPWERVMFLNLSSFKAVFILFCLKYSPRCLFEKTLLRLFPNFYAWALFRRREERKIAAQVSSSYKDCAGARQAAPHVISIFCGNTSHGGLVDRLRGAVSVYLICKETGRSFKIHFVHPFPLTDYLVPAAYDWTIRPDEVSFRKADTVTIISDTATNTQWERRRQERFIRRRIADTSRQAHVYTNAAFCYDRGFGQLFNELFRPAPRLQDHIDSIKSQIGGRYISVSARFLNLMGDFNEENYSEPLPPDEREALMAGCLGKIEELHRRYADRRILVCSDSTGFLARASAFEYTFVIPGTVSHIDNDSPHDYEYYEKTFLDFFTIAGAERVFLLKERRMMNSGFPYAAALANGREYEVIRF